MTGPFEDDGDMDDVAGTESSQLDELGKRFLTALTHKDEGRIDEAEEELRAILAIEPRLGEPRIELARILLDTDRLEDAEEHAREGLGALESGGAWTVEVPENVIKAVAHALLAEILRRRADDDDVIFGDADAWRALVDESKAHFEKAAALDPSDEYASYHAFFLGLKGHGGKVDFGDDVDDES